MSRLFFLTLIMLFLSKSYAQEFLGSHTVGKETKTYSKILVVAKAKNETKRVEMEDDIVKRLKKEGIDAVPSYLRLTNELLEAKKQDEEALETFVSILREKDFDGILVTSLVGTNESVEYNPAEYRTTTVPVRYGRFGRYYTTARVGVYEPASVEKHKNFVFESLLYDLRASSKEDSLHWIGKIKVTDPTDFDKATDQYAKTMVNKLTKEAIK